MSARKADRFHSHGAMTRYAIEAFAPGTVTAKRNGDVVLRDTCLGAGRPAPALRSEPKPQGTPGAFGNEPVEFDDANLAQAAAALGIDMSGVKAES